MGLELIKAEYHLNDNEGKDIPGFEKTVFGPSSDDYLKQPQAVEFTRKQEMIPPSLLEAIAVREYSDDPKSWKFQRTRTGALIGVSKGEVYVAFDDIPDARKNIVIARAQEGYNLKTSNPRKQLIIHGKTLNEILKRAEKDKRIHPLPEDGHVVANIAEYGTNPYFVAVEGCMAPVNAKLIQSKDRNEGHLGLPSRKYVLKHVKEGEAMVLPVGFGGIDCGIRHIYTIGGFDTFGFVRGVRNAPTFAEINKAWKKR